jgi:hypothetical protein
MKKTPYSLPYWFIAGIAATVFTACSKPKVNDQGITETNLNAAFTVTPVAGSANKFIIAATDSSYIMSKWDIGDGAGAVIGKHSQEVFYPDAGTYTVTHYAVGKGGKSFTESKTVNVATTDPAAGNLIQGGKFETAADDAKWTRLNISAPFVTWTMAGGKMTATGGSWGHSGIYQAINVQANKDYRFGMLVSGSGATDTWFEVYLGTVAPAANTDYSNGGIQIALNTWAGCGNVAFSGNINKIGCEGALKGKDGKIRFATAGTVYLVIKTGGANLGTSGITIDNVELRGI